MASPTLIRSVAAVALTVAVALAAPAVAPDPVAVPAAEAVIGSASTADFSADVV